MSLGSAKTRNKPQVADTVLDLICNTPLVKLHKLTTPEMATGYVKLEYMNPGGSV